jgi:Flp pilus assembly protein protease CpaA
MERYYFLFGLTFLWLIFASIQDLRKREVANWLNYSLITFALGYRFFYSIELNDPKFLIFGLVGGILFFAIANLLYYTRVFAGGDAKLLMGIGLILPYESLTDLILYGGEFLFLLFGIGAVYTLIWSIFIAAKNKDKFYKGFKENIKKSVKWYLVALVISLISILYGFNVFMVLLIVFLFFITLYCYLMAVDRCMVKLVKPKDLTEGDWIISDVNLGKKVIKRTVHGLTLEDIKLLRKKSKGVYIKEGVPFVPSFFFAFVIRVFFLEFSKVSLIGLLARFSLS